jgi:hypothetical protein
MDNKLREKLEQLAPIRGIVWEDICDYLVLVGENDGDSYREGGSKLAASKAVSDFVRNLRQEFAELEKIVESEIQDSWNRE